MIRSKVSILSLMGHYVFTETIAYISSKLPSGTLTFNEAHVAVLGNTSTPFVMRRPGLTNEASTVSIMSLEKPGWYLRHFEESIYLEPKLNPRDSDTFDIDATFYERENVFFEGYVTFVPVNVDDGYIVYNDSGMVSVGSFKDSSEFRERASFAVVESENTETGSVLHRRKRNAGGRTFSITLAHLDMHARIRKLLCVTNAYLLCKLTYNMPYIYGCIFNSIQFNSLFPTHLRSIAHNYNSISQHNRKMQKQHYK